MRGQVRSHVLDRAAEAALRRPGAVVSLASCVAVALCTAAAMFGGTSRAPTVPPSSPGGQRQDAEEPGSDWLSGDTAALAPRSVRLLIVLEATQASAQREMAEAVAFELLDVPLVGSVQYREAPFETPKSAAHAAVTSPETRAALLRKLSVHREAFQQIVANPSLEQALRMAAAAVAVQSNGGAASAAGDPSSRLPMAAAVALLRSVFEQITSDRLAQYESPWRRMLGLPLPPDERYFFSEDRRFLHMVVESTPVPPGLAPRRLHERRFVQAVGEAVEGVGREFPDVTIGMLGGPARAGAMWRLGIIDSLRSAALCLAGCLLFLVVFVRGFGHGLALALSWSGCGAALAGAIVWTAHAANGDGGGLTGAALPIALALALGSHVVVMSAYEAARDRGLSREAAVRDAIAGAGRGLLFRAMPLVASGGVGFALPALWRGGTDLQLAGFGAAVAASCVVVSVAATTVMPAWLVLLPDWYLAPRADVSSRVHSALHVASRALKARMGAVRQSFGVFGKGTACADCVGPSSRRRRQIAGALVAIAAIVALAGLVLGAPFDTSGPTWSHDVLPSERLDARLLAQHGRAQFYATSNPRAAQLQTVASRLRELSEVAWVESGPEMQSRGEFSDGEETSAAAATETVMGSATEESRPAPARIGSGASRGARVRSEGEGVAFIDELLRGAAHPHAGLSMTKLLDGVSGLGAVLSRRQLPGSTTGPTTEPTQRDQLGERARRLLRSLLDSIETTRDDRVRQAAVGARLAMLEERMMEDLRDTLVVARGQLLGDAKQFPATQARQAVEGGPGARGVAPGGEHVQSTTLLRIYPHPATLQSEEALAQFVEAIRHVDPDAGGAPVEALALRRSASAGYLWATLWGAVLVFACFVWLALLRRPAAQVPQVPQVPHSARTSCVSLRPFVAAVVALLVATIAVRFLCETFQVAHLAAVPMLLGVVFGIHEGFALLPRKHVALFALCTAMGFGSLTLAHHSGMQGLAIVVCVGLLASVLALLTPNNQR